MKVGAVLQLILSSSDLFLEMDTEFPANLILNPSHVKVEPVSPGPAQDSLLNIKTEPGLAVKQEEPDQTPLRPLSTAASSGGGLSLLKPSPTIVITSRPTTRLLVPKLPTSSSLKVEETGGRWVGGKAATKIVVGSQQSVKSSSRRAIDSHLISTNTVSGNILHLPIISSPAVPIDCDQWSVLTGLGNQLLTWL